MHQSIQSGPIQPEVRLPSITLRFPLEPGQLFCWELAADAELFVLRERVWLTRFDSNYDYWLEPGETLHLHRNERVRISTDGQKAAEISVTSAYSGSSCRSHGWFGRLRAMVGSRPALALRSI
jgi:hypothetical protein